ncbi:cytochrome P450 CYP736A12-like [Pyrus ussuriensis x Pyrus communis]|uniref:Cytochrome P450 CYP736A12-like n=1 Tax=Pyrus ussuriensis x Pyrus communis TaxID=2448454 RepID=A0A5N5I1V6_9ROSA|nr:cytochrome P450 CYP736A12-like [Pyrus ussuriensis x Pyrus communis]
MSHFPQIESQNDYFSNGHPHALPYLPLVSHPHPNLWIPKVETPRNTASWAYSTTNHCNLHMLGKFPYRSHQHLAEKYGPIMSIHLGFVPTIVVSSPKAAKLFLKTHDSVFASCPTLQVCDYLTYGQKGMALTYYGPYWWQARKLCTQQLFYP